MILRFVAAFALIVIAQYVLFRLFALRRFAYTCALSQNRVGEGETVELCETIENGGFFPLLWIRVEYRFSEALPFIKNDNTTVAALTFHRSVFSAPPFCRVRRVYKIACMKRGYYPIGAASVLVGDLLGLASYALVYRGATALHVYPTPLPWRDLSLPSRLWLGDMVVRRFILPDPFMPAGVRGYAPGDPLNHINWKASAKVGGLLVHRHDYTADSRLTVVFDVEYEGYILALRDKTMEAAIRLLAAALDFAIANGMSAALRTNSTGSRDGAEVTVPSGFGRVHRERLFTAMAEMGFKQTRSLPALLQEMSETVRDTDILIMTRSLSKGSSAGMKALRGAGNKVEVFLIPDCAPQGGVAV
ncbi:MAG: DUF58 domain-containing protein [Oscillospiraceae bacterium]|jgi:uncharacterized protein (DUF58 family)|nr:DUF58 domain-containing protein [Oscillospiraceae bacterium]